MSRLRSTRPVLRSRPPDTLCEESRAVSEQGTAPASLAEPGRATPSPRGSGGSTAISRTPSLVERPFPVIRRADKAGYLMDTGGAKFRYLFTRQAQAAGGVGASGKTQKNQGCPGVQEEDDSAVSAGDEMREEERGLFGISF